MTAPTTSELIERLREFATELANSGAQIAAEQLIAAVSSGAEQDDMGELAEKIGMLTDAASRLADLEREREEWESGHWINADDVAALAKQLDDAWNGPLAAKRPALCDVVGQIVDEAPLFQAAERSLQEAKGVIERAAEDLNEIALGRPGGPITRTDAPKWLERAERIAMTGREAVYTFLHRCGPEPAKPEVSEHG